MLLVISAGAIPVCAECSIGKLHTNITGAGASFFLFFLFGCTARCYTMFLTCIT